MLRDDSECILGSWDAMNEDIGLFFCQRKNSMGSIEGDAKHSIIRAGLNIQSIQKIDYRVKFMR
jgi:hypothetical protein